MRLTPGSPRRRAILCPQRDDGRRGFTLIELLVVVAIIALLISILLPSLGEAREQAKTVKCGVNLRNIGQALIACQTENREFSPTWDDGVTQGAPSGVRSTYLYTWGEVLFDTGYYGDRDGFFCPTDKLPDRPLEARTAPGGGYERFAWVENFGMNTPVSGRKPGWHGSYGVNAIMHGNFLEDRFQDAARQVFIADAWWVWFSGIGAARVMAPRVGLTLPDPNWPIDGNEVAWRHGKSLRAQFLCRDGHVEVVQPRVPAASQISILNDTVDTATLFTWLPGESASRGREHDYDQNNNPARIVAFNNKLPKWVDAINNRIAGWRPPNADRFNVHPPSFPEQLSAVWRSHNRAWRQLPSEFPQRF